jgi:hypothetical protein
MNSAAISLLAEAGIEGIAAEVALRRLQSELVSLSPSTQAKLEAFHLRPEDLDPNLHRLSEVVRRLVDGGLSEDDTQEIFGRRAAAAVLVLMRGIDRFEALQKPGG